MRGLGRCRIRCRMTLTFGLFGKGKNMTRSRYSVVALTFVMLVLGRQSLAQETEQVKIDYVAHTMTIAGGAFGTVTPTVHLAGTLLTVTSFNSTTQVIVASLPTSFVPGTYRLQVRNNNSGVVDELDITIGTTGPPGPQGPIGLTGATGAQGPAGSRGPVGLQGPIGLTGAIGPAGATGAIGPQGVKGDTGAIGAQGPQGGPGPQGLTGAIGPQGSKGDIGAAGPQGPQGPAGTSFSLPFVGLDSTQGPPALSIQKDGDGAVALFNSTSSLNTQPALVVATNANNAAAGALFEANNPNASYPVLLSRTFGLASAAFFAVENPQSSAPALLVVGNGVGRAAEFSGNVEVTGALTINGQPAGLQGPQGPTGPLGPVGAQGPQGPKGDTGATGAMGAGGAAGPQGPQGALGPQGATGPAGPAGPQGPQGVQGSPGPAAFVQVTSDSHITQTILTTTYVNLCSISFTPTASTVLLTASTFVLNNNFNVNGPMENNFFEASTFIRKTINGVVQNFDQTTAFAAETEEYGRSDFQKIVTFDSVPVGVPITYDLQGYSYTGAAANRCSLSVAEIHGSN